MEGSLPEMEGGWDELADGSFFLQKREWDPVASTVTMRHVLVRAR